MNSHRLPIAFLFFFVSGIVTPAESADWPRWRGPLDAGIADFGTYPVRLDESTTRWRAPLPGKGCSTPIVLDQTIYLTAPVDGKDALLSIDWSGNRLWTTVFGDQTPGKHRNASGCNASPVTDGSGVFVYFKSGTLAAVDLDGTVRWKTNLVERFGPDERFWDHGTSPVLTENHVVFARMHAGDSWLAAFDKNTGEVAWKVARNYSVPLEADQCYTTPLVIQHEGREALLVWGTQHVTIHDAADGAVRWSCGGFNRSGNKLWPAIANPVIVGDMVVLCFGRNDRGTPRMHGIRLAGSGDVTETNHVWRRDDVGSFVPSPAVHGGHVYLVRDRGEVECIDPATGQTIWSDAFPKGRASYYASPLIAGGKLYAAREDGMVFVAEVGADRFKLLAENDMAQPVIGSPVPASNCILIRGEHHLFCFASPAAED
jgi:outer membrane protein assembly factor BamB